MTDNRRRRKVKRKKKSTIVNKTRFAIFCMVCIFLLAFIFIKVVLPKLGGGEDLAQKEESFVEDTEDLAQRTETSATGEGDLDPAKEALREERLDKLPGKNTQILSRTDGDLVYFNQEDPAWARKTYGPKNPIGTHACGPVVMASVVSSLTDQIIDPVEMSNWSYENGYYVPDGGSLHELIPAAAQSFGLNVEPLYYPNPETIKDLLEEGKVIVMVSGHGIFSEADGHFVILRDLDEEGNIMVSDSVNLDHNVQPFTAEELIGEASPVSSGGGPFWAIWP